ncbi:pyrroline-5-carboxylate reductase [Elusimicrobiota bacterium]
MNKIKLSVMGCGKMGRTIIKAINEGLDKYEIFGFEKREDIRKKVQEDLGVEVRELIDKAHAYSVCIIAVKPQDISSAVDSIAGFELNNRSSMLIISIAAGVTLKYLRSRLSGYPVIRVMPNTPALVGCGMTAIARDQDVSEHHLKTAEEIFSCMGNTVIVEEKYMDAITAISGSGPAYFFYIAEIIEKYAHEIGLDHDAARILISGTVKGSGMLMCESEDSFKTLKDNVTSPGGTTEAALKHLKNNNFEDIFYNAIGEATKRSKELSDIKREEDK